METIVIQAKNKTTSNYVKKLLKELEGTESVSTLSTSDKEDLAMFADKLALVKHANNKNVSDNLRQISLSVYSRRCRMVYQLCIRK
jgi:hypothetical protein